MKPCCTALAVCPMGAVPFSFLTMDESGNIYGAAQYGGSPPNPAVCFGNGCGTVFKLDTKGNMRTLYTFTGGAEPVLGDLQALHPSRRRRWWPDEHPCRYAFLDS